MKLIRRRLAPYGRSVVNRNGLVPRIVAGR